MKKFILSALVALFGFAAASAQGTIFNNPTNRAYFGVRVGADITCPGNVKSGPLSIDMFGNGAGIEFGGIYNIPLVANLYIEPGVKLFYDTYPVDDLVSGDGDWTTEVDMSIRKFGMRIPVMFGYHFDFTPDVKVSLFTGPEFEVAFSGKCHVSVDGESASESIYGDDGMNRVNLLWGVGAGIEFSRFYLGFNGGIGMLNMSGDSQVKFHENRVTISLGYNF